MTVIGDYLNHGGSTSPCLEIYYVESWTSESGSEYSGWGQLLPSYRIKDTCVSET